MQNCPFCAHSSLVVEYNGSISKKINDVNIVNNIPLSDNKLKNEIMGIADTSRENASMISNQNNNSKKQNESTPISISNSQANQTIFKSNSPPDSLSYSSTNKLNTSVESRKALEMELMSQRINDKTSGYFSYPEPKQNIISPARASNSYGRNILLRYRNLDESSLSSPVQTITSLREAFRNSRRNYNLDNSQREIVYNDNNNSPVDSNTTDEVYSSNFDTDSRQFRNRVRALDSRRFEHRSINDLAHIEEMMLSEVCINYIYDIIFISLLLTLC